MKARTPANETERLAALRAYRILDTDAEQAYDDLAGLASYICRTPIAMISLVDQSRQWFKSKVGVDQRETSRDVAFCAHAILQPGPMIVHDATADDRFSDSTLVTGDPHVRFYAGFPLVNPEGLALGTICAVDRRPGNLDAAQEQAMQSLSRQVMALLEQRRVTRKLAEALEHVKTLSGLVPICAWCKRVRDDQGYWKQVESYIRSKTDADFTHGICPECMEKERPRPIPKLATQNRPSA